MGLGEFLKLLDLETRTTRSMDFRGGGEAGWVVHSLVGRGQTTVFQVSGRVTSQKLIDRLIRFCEFVLGAIFPC